MDRDGDRESLPGKLTRKLFQEAQENKYMEEPGRPRDDPGECQEVAVEGRVRRKVFRLGNDRTRI